MSFCTPLGVGLFLLLCSPLAAADCSDKTFICPTGEEFTVGLCWSWSHFQCLTCRDIITEMRSKCRRYACGNPKRVENWYNRNDGCSADGLSDVMTGVFRAACAIHDICYATPGRTKWECDSEFLDNMEHTCLMPGIGSIGLPVCYASANTAYHVVERVANIFPSFAATCEEV